MSTGQSGTSKAANGYANTTSTESYAGYTYDPTTGQYYYYDATTGQYYYQADQPAYAGYNAATVTDPTAYTQYGATYNAPGTAGSTTTTTTTKKKGKKATQEEIEQKKKKRAATRVAGGEVWEDPTLLEWDPNDFRLFAGDLGNEITDETLRQAFSKYPTLQKVHVVREKRTNKSKGYGFISFKSADDFVRAWKEMNGKYVGNRPIKLRKSTWQERNVDVRLKKEREKGAPYTYTKLK